MPKTDLMASSMYSNMELARLGTDLEAQARKGPGNGLYDVAADTMLGYLRNAPMGAGIGPRQMPAPEVVQPNA